MEGRFTGIKLEVDRCSVVFDKIGREGPKEGRDGTRGRTHTPPLPLPTHTSTHTRITQKPHLGRPSASYSCLRSGPTCAFRLRVPVRRSATILRQCRSKVCTLSTTNRRNVGLSGPGGRGERGRERESWLCVVIYHVSSALFIYLYVYVYYVYTYIVHIHNISAYIYTYVCTL